MKHFNKIKEHLRDEHEGLPENLSWEKMEDAILGDDSGAKKEFWLKNWKKFSLTLFSFAIILLVWVFFNTYNSTSDKEFDAIKNKNLSSSNYQNVVKQNNTKTIAQQEKNTNIRISDKNQISNEKTIQARSQELSTYIEESMTDHLSNSNAENKIDTKGLQNEGSEVRLVPKVNSKIKTNRINNGATPKLNLEHKMYPTEVHTKTKNLDIENIDGSSIIPESRTSTSIDKNEKRNFISIAALDDAVDLLTIYRPEIILDAEVAGVEPLQSKQTVSPWSISVGGGVNYWNPGLNKDVYKNTNGRIGNQYGVGVDYNISNNWTISSGLSFSTWNTRLDYSNVRLVDRLVKDTLIGYTTNPVSGLKKDIVGSTYVVDTITRRVLWDNSYQTLRIPLTISYNTQKGSYRYGFGVGISASILRSAEGILQQGIEFAKFSEVEMLYTNRIAFGGLVSANLERELNEKVGIGINVNVNQQLTDWSKKDAFRINATQVSSTLFIRYSF